MNTQKSSLSHTTLGLIFIIKKDYNDNKALSQNTTVFLELELEMLNNTIIVLYEAYNEFYLLLYIISILNLNSYLFGLHSKL